MPSSRTDDRVVLKDLSLFAKHGLFDAEAELGQRFYIDVTVEADLSYAEKADEAEGTVNWADLADVTTDAFTKRRYKLVEAAAAAIVRAVLAHFKCADRVRSRYASRRRPSRRSSPTRRSSSSGSADDVIALSGDASN